jgi:uncharacterized protein (TIGR03083 family)
MTDNAETPTLRDLLASLHRSHDRLASVIGGLADDDFAEPSYDDDWNLGQVASHLGSGAEIFTLVVDAGLQGEPAPGGDRFSPIWEVWNAKSPAAQGRDAVTADAGFLAAVDDLSDDVQASWEMDLFGARRALDGLLQMRLGEHALHTWDIEVAGDPTAIVPDAEAALVLNGLGFLAGRASQGVAEPVTINVTTSAPNRQFILALTADGASLSATAEGAAEGAADATATLEIPAEAFVRLIYGRLDPDHTPAGIAAEGVTLETLRAAFPGF